MADKIERNEVTFFGSVRRFARTSGAVGGIAARVAGERVFGIKTDRAAHAEDLRQILGGLKGPLMKVAQILTTIPDALPPEYAAELSELQANAPSMGWPFVRRRMAGELGPDWQSRFKTFGHEAAAAASLGQVHKAELPDARIVACKLQYPDMPSTVEADLRQLKIAMAIYHRMDNAIQHDEIYKELSERLREELDYLREASQMRLYQAMLAEVPDVHVPTPIAELTTARLLTMTWLEGDALQRWLDTEPPLEARNRVAKALFRAWYVPFYHYGVIHGDPHLGNYQIRPDGGVNLLDFGAIRVFPATFVRGVIDLFEAIRDRDDAKAAEAYRNWGFSDVTPQRVAVLNGWARFLYEPLLDDRVRPIQDTSDGQFGRSVAEEVHSGLKSIGGVKPPREFVLMDRSAVGLGSVFLRLKAELNWSHLYHEVTAGFDTEALAHRQAEALAAAGVPPPK
jgi:predicted unusual protein kinase regulating ubiquinone biosynthesis (AarF/ABC1/UbiB family)